MPYTVNDTGHVAAHNLIDVKLAALPATYAPPIPSIPAAGILWGFAGDSITNGSSASNFFFSYSRIAVGIVGGMVARPDYIEAGTSGIGSAQMLLNTPAMLAYGVGAVHIQIGTNDAGSGVTVGAYAANVTAIIALCKAKGAAVTIGLVPPRGSSVSTANQLLLNAYNTWIRVYAPTLGATVADTYTPLVDTTTGLMAASIDSGDGVHPNDLGHNLMACAVAKAMQKAARTATPNGLVTSVTAGNIIPDPLNTRATVTAGGWFEWAGGTGGTPVYTFVNDTSGFLPAGRWAEMDFDCTTTGGSRSLAIGISSGFAVGDKILMVTTAQVQDMNGSWATDVAAGFSVIGLSSYDQGLSGISSGPLDHIPGSLDPVVANTYNFTVVHPITVPAGCTQIILWNSVRLPTGRRVKARFGALGLINLTTLGLTTQFNWAPNAINT